MTANETVRWRVDVPTAERRDTATLRGVRITSGGKAWYWMYNRRTGWTLQGEPVSLADGHG